LPDSQNIRLSVKRKVIKTFRQFFADENGSEDKIFAIWGSAGFLELAINRGSAAALLKASCGDPVIASV